MSEPDATRDQWSGPRRYRWDTPEFGRVANLSDGVFAIALTLLVLTLDVPEVAGTDLTGALLAEGHQVALFALSFLLVANLWWVHHRFFALLGELESGLIVANLMILGLVALVPFPTSLVGRHPTVPAAVVPFIAVFLAITVLMSLALLRARRVNAWREPLPQGLFTWFLGGWAVYVAILAMALAVAFRWPVAGLVILATSGPVLEILMGRIAPSAYRHWAP
ncbi:MAG: DUF1211 domain-containing protein [Gemmatimonadales bacterium]|nr:MAG: DUF1211 domain-containing protein [Gemmatimonadales bacterium]